MYLLGWMVLVIVSLVMSFSAFVWAIRTDQFEDQGRARYLVLEDGPPPSPRPRYAKRPAEVYALAAVGALVLLGLSAPVVLCLVRLGRS